MNTNVRLALLFALALSAWFISGIFSSPDSAESVPQAGNTYLTKVEVASSSQQSFNPLTSLRAKTKANRDVQVLAQVSGTVTATLVEEGSSVLPGQGICQIDAEDRHLRLAQAKASLENANIAYRGALKLKSAGYQSELAISQAKAAQAMARTNLKRARLDVEHLQINAPFAGIVESRPVEIGDLIIPGQLCATVVELDPLKIEALLSETEIGSLSIGDKASIVIAGKVYAGAEISYLAHQANRDTNGYRVEATMPNPNQILRAGISARMNIQTVARPAHLIPASAILLDDAGDMVVRVLDQDNRAASVRVTAIGESPKGIWVTGLEMEVILITVGQNYIIDGEQVEPSYQASSLQQ